MTTETPKPVEVTQADRDLRNALEQHAHGDQGGNGYLTDDALPLLARHRLSTRPEAQSLPTVSSVDLVVRFLDPGIGSLLDDGSLNRETSGRYAQVAERARELLAALSPTVSEADEAVKQLIHGSMSRDFERRYTVSEADGLAEAVRRAAQWFRDYEQQHRAKRTQEGELKADTNAERAAYLEAALRAQPTNEAGGWRDIASAPKDGTWVWAYWPVSTYEDQQTPTRWVETSLKDGPYWQDSADHIDWTQPTHWQPLPAAPGAASVQAGGEVERLIEALKFYARASTYLRQPTGGLAVAATPIDCDRGDRARAALNPEGNDHAG